MKGDVAGAVRTLRAAASPGPEDRVVPLSPQMVGLRFQASARAAGVESRVTAHSARVGSGQPEAADEHHHGVHHPGHRPGPQARPPRAERARPLVGRLLDHRKRRPGPTAEPPDGGPPPGSPEPPAPSDDSDPGPPSALFPSTARSVSSDIGAPPASRTLPQPNPTTPAVRTPLGTGREAFDATSRSSPRRRLN